MCFTEKAERLLLEISECKDNSLRKECIRKALQSAYEHGLETAALNEQECEESKNW